MSNSDSSKSAVQRATRAADRRTRTSGSRKRVTRRERNVTRVLSAVIAIAIVVLVIRALRADQRDAHAIAERELRVNTLQPGEELHRSTAVFKRSLLSLLPRDARHPRAHGSSPGLSRRRTARHPRRSRPAADVRAAGVPARHQRSCLVGPRVIRAHERSRDHDAHRAHQARRAFGVRVRGGSLDRLDERST